MRSPRFSSSPSSSLLLRSLFDGTAHHDDPTLWAGHTTMHQQEVALGIHTQDSEPLHSGAHVAHVASHAQALEHASGVGRSDRTWLADVHRSMGLRPAAEPVTSHHALEPLALRGAGHVHQLTFTEDLAGQLLTGLHPLVVTDLSDPPSWRLPGLAELAQPGLVQALSVDGAESEPGGPVTVTLRRAQVKHPTGASLKDRDGRHRAVWVEDLGHAQLAGQQSLRHGLQLDLDGDTGREVEPHQRIHHTGIGIQDVHDALVGAHLELFPRVLVDER